MNCDEVKAYLDLLVDDELSTNVIPSVMQHLDECITCQGEWQEQLALRRSFRDLSGSIDVDVRADLELIDKRLASIDTETVFRKRTRRTWLVAVCLATLTFLSTYFLYSRQNAKVPWQLDDITTNFITASKGTESVDLTEVQKHVEFDVKALSIPGYSLIGAEVLHVPDRKSACLAKLTYRSLSELNQDDIVCYQACRGQINASMLHKRVIAQQTISCGQIQGLYMVYWPKDNRDHLLVSSIPENELMKIAVRMQKVSG